MLKTDDTSSTVVVPEGGGGGGGMGVLWYFHTYVGSGHFWGVQNFEFQNFGGFSEKLIFLGYVDFVDIFFWWGGGGGGFITKLDYI